MPLSPRYYAVGNYCTENAASFYKRLFNIFIQYIAQDYKKIGVLPFYLVFMSYCVCQFGSCLAVVYIIVFCVTLETNVNCSPRWIVRPQIRTLQATNKEADTLRQCLDECVAAAKCVTAEWVKTDQWPCWLQYIRATRRFHPHIMQYEIIRHCDTTSGSVHHNASSRNTLL